VTLPDRWALGLPGGITIPYSSTGSDLALGPVSVRRALIDNGLPILLAPNEAVERWLCLREGFPSVETESPRGPGPGPVPSCETESGFADGKGGGPMIDWPRSVLVERWLLLRPPSRESVEELRLLRPVKMPLVRLRVLILLDSIGVGGLKSGELGLEVEGVGIDDAVLEVILLVKERRGPGIR